MSKIICLSGLIVCVLVFLIFVVDLSAAIPFGRYSLAMDIVAIISSAAMGALGWLTYREQDK